MKKLSLGLGWIATLALFSASGAQAIEHTFTFTIASSGPSIYACNAGLKHGAPAVPQVCYLAGTENGPTTSCVPGTHNCVCTGTNGGAFLKDFMAYKKGVFDQTALVNGTPVDAGTSGYNQIFSNNQFGQRIDQLSFNLGSERYGAEFFVDVCYHGPQIEYSEKGVNVNFALNSRVTVTDISASYSYRTLAGLKGSAVAVCDTQGHGTYIYARNLGGIYDTFDTEVNIGNVAATGNGYGATAAETTLTASTHTMFNNSWITLGTPRSPRFCVVRYSFREGNENNVRRWQRHDALSTLWTSIEEAQP